MTEQTAAENVRSTHYTVGLKFSSSRAFMSPFTTANPIHDLNVEKDLRVSTY